MTNTNPRNLIKLLIDALKEECNWIDNPKHDELIAIANAYVAQYKPEVSTDEGLNSKSSPNNLQIRSSGITPPQWQARIETMGADVPAILLEAAQWGADQELEACRLWVSENCDIYSAVELIKSRRPKPQNFHEPKLNSSAAL